MSDLPEDIQAPYIGIATVLTRYERLFVPKNQREYAWQDKHVMELFKDLKKAMASGSYFLGTIVLTTSRDKQYEIADGQQRLATISILLSAIRDYFEEHNQSLLVQDLSHYLYTVDTRANLEVPRLTLNVQDRDFFAQRILPSKIQKPLIRAIEPEKTSHRLIAQAQQLAIRYIDDLLRTESSSAHIRVLNDWIDFIKKSARVIVFPVPTALGAFVLFETMNDRGLKTTQADLVKNFLFGEADRDGRIADAQIKWASMAGKLEVLGEEDITLNYIRQMAISYWGYVTDKKLFQDVMDRATGSGPANAYLSKLDDGSSLYAAIRSPSHSQWKDYPEGTVAAVRTLSFLPMEPIKPLMLAVTRHFTKEETFRAFKLFVSWVVRLLVVGGGRSGRVEQGFADCAKTVSAKDLGEPRPHYQSANDLAAAMHPDIIPNDAAFEAAFAIHKTDGALARFYLRAVEVKYKNLPEPEWVPNEEPDINLEHVMPQNPESNWPEIEPEDAKANYRRLGNLALLQRTKNTLVGNGPWVDKKPVLLASTYQLTKWIGKKKKWGIAQINERQTLMARYAKEIWTLVLR